MQSSFIDLPPAFNATGPDVERVSPKYKFYSTRELVQPLLDDHWEITTAFQVQPRVRDARFAKHLVRVTHPSLQLGQDRLEMLIRNSHDGEQKLQIDLGAWRMVCSNGIITEAASFARLAVTHTRAFETVQAKAQAVIESAPAVAAVFDAWKSRELNQHEQYFIANAARKLRWGTLADAPVGAEAMLTIRRDEDRGNSLWTVFNRVQENLLRGGLNNERQLRARRTRAIRSIDESVRLNKGLWRAAERAYEGDLVLPA